VRLPRYFELQKLLSFFHFHLFVEHFLVYRYAQILVISYEKLMASTFVLVVVQRITNVLIRFLLKHFTSFLGVITKLSNVRLRDSLDFLIKRGNTGACTAFLCLTWLSQLYKSIATTFLDQLQYTSEFLCNG
jgi:hypothetical protein